MSQPLTCSSDGTQACAGAAVHEAGRRDLETVDGVPDLQGRDGPHVLAADTRESPGPGTQGLLVGVTEDSTMRILPMVRLKSVHPGTLERAITPCLINPGNYTWPMSINRVALPRQTSKSHALVMTRGDGSGRPACQVRWREECHDFGEYVDDSETPGRRLQCVVRSLEL